MVLNRADTNVGVTQDDVSAIIGRAPDVLVPSHRDVVRSVNEGAPIVQGRPRTEVAQSFRALADLYLGTPRARAAAPAAAEEACLMDLQERLPGVRPADEAARPTRSPRSRTESTSESSATSGRSSSTRR